MRIELCLHQNRSMNRWEAPKQSLRGMTVPLILCLLVVTVALGQDDPDFSDLTFEPTWDSVKTHQVPEWFHDAELGIFPVWGLYSIPGWAPTTGELGKVDWDTWFRDNPYAEWYWNSMKIKDSPTWKHHVANLGGHSWIGILFRLQPKRG